MEHSLSTLAHNELVLKFSTFWYDGLGGNDSEIKHILGIVAYGRIVLKCRKSVSHWPMWGWF
jgi:hypothetical protein